MYNTIQQIVTNNPLIRIKESEFKGETLYVCKYSRKVFYNNLWDSILVEARGLVLDRFYNIVAYPFTKIFNYGIEANAPKFRADEQVTAIRKVNGFMVAMTNFKGKLLVSTTGTIDSKYVAMARELISKELQDYILSTQEITFMFECVHRDDPHIIPEYEGLYYLGQRYNGLQSYITTTNKAMASLKGVSIPEQLHCSFQEVLDAVKTCKHEGYVVYNIGADGNQKVTKIKSPYYLMSKAIARASGDKLSRLRVDEEFHPLLKQISQDETFVNLTEQERLEYIRKYYENMGYQ